MTVTESSEHERQMEEWRVWYQSALAISGASYGVFIDLTSREKVQVKSELGHACGHLHALFLAEWETTACREALAALDQIRQEVDPLLARAEKAISELARFEAWLETGDRADGAEAA